MENDIAFWIREVRGEMTQVEFAKCVYHYEISAGQRECIPYHRNQIANWEKGRNKNFNTESFLSIALLDYDKQYPKKCETKQERNQRFLYAADLMKKMLGLELYCRNLHDALLIQVCRDVLSFPELLEKEKEYEERLKPLANSKGSEYLPLKEKSRISLQRETETIRIKLYGISTQEELDELFEENRKFFFTANRVLGERFLKIYNSADRYPERLELEEAVQIYAPNYRDSYMRMFSSSGITREWLLDLCEHLRFSKEEKKQALENAHMQPLTEEECAVKTDYEEIMEWSLEEKLEIMLLFSLYVKMEKLETLAPVEYLTESFSLYKQGKGALKELKKILCENKKILDTDDWVSEELEKQLLGSSGVYAWIECMRSGYSNIQNEKMRTAFREYRQEHQEYFELFTESLENLNKGKMPVTDKENLEEAKKLHYLSALFYTILTGKYYTGKVTGEDAQTIEIQFKKEEKKEPESEINYIYNFFTLVFWTFLEKEPLIAVTEKNGKVQNGKFCVYDKRRKKYTRGIDIEEICENLWMELFYRIYGTE